MNFMKKRIIKTILYSIVGVIAGVIGLSLSDAYTAYLPVSIASRIEVLPFIGFLAGPVYYVFAGKLDE